MTGAPGWRTSSSMVCLEVSPPPVAVTVTRAMPSASATLRRKVAMSSPGEALTGRSTSSSGPSTRGRVASTMSGFFTVTVRSAAPNAPSWPATTITRTSPTYWGIGTWCVAVLPAASSNGPSKSTIGLKRFACGRLPLSPSPSPPMVNMPSSTPP